MTFLQDWTNFLLEVLKKLHIPLGSFISVLFKDTVDKNLAVFFLHVLFFSLEVLRKTYTVSYWLLILESIFHAKSRIMTQAFNSIRISS